MRIGIYGGTFDPPHLGHMRAAQAAAAVLGLDRLLFVPAAQPPHKALSEQAASAEDRLAMASLMAEGLCLDTGRPGLAGADGLELDRAGKSYTADTLQALHERYPGDELWLLVGTDMFLTLQHWREPERILALAGVAAFARAEADCGDLLNVQADYLSKTYGARVALVQLPQITDVSSTDLRRLLRTRREDAAPLLWCQVYGYLLRNGLYGVDADLTRLSDADLRAVSYSMIRAKRIPHIRGTEEEAVRLALRWGADPAVIRRAAILHDCTKYLNLEEQLRLCAKYDIILDYLERGTVKLLHAKTGAALAEHVFGQGPEVCRAILWHTTGRADMTLAEKVLYLADYIEPSREDFEGLSQLRALAYEDIDRALLLGCELTMEDMASRGNEIHRNTRQARDFLKGRIE